MVTLKEFSSGRTYITHHDRLSNSSLYHEISDQNTEVLENLSKHANSSDNEQDPKDDFKPTGNPDYALVRTRYGRVVKPNRDSAFEYSNVILELFTFTTSAMPQFIVAPRSAYRVISSVSRTRVASFAAPSAFSQSNSLSSMQETDIRRAKRAKFEDIGEQVFTVSDLEGAGQLMCLLKSNGTLFFFDLKCGDWLAYCDDSPRF